MHVPTKVKTGLQLGQSTVIGVIGYFLMQKDAELGTLQEKYDELESRIKEIEVVSKKNEKDIWGFIQLKDEMLKEKAKFFEQYELKRK